MFNVKIILVLICCVSYVLSSDILLISSVASISHSRWYGKLALLLAKNGHQVTVIDTDKCFFEHPNITSRLMEGGYVWLEEMEEEVRKNPNALDAMVEANTVLENLQFLADPKSLGCVTLMRSKGFKDFLKEFKGKTFDLIIGDGFCECFFGLVPYFGNPPLIPASPYVENLASEFVGLLDNPSYVPFHMCELSPKMSMIERLKNFVFHLMNVFIVKNYYLPQNNAIMKEVFGESVPNLDAILKDIPLVMTGNSFAIQGAKPLPPNYIAIGGFHVDPPQPLPENIKKFLDEAKDGAILFSMGSNFKSILMSGEKREMFLSVFRKIPQRVIWKLEVDSKVNIPSNVMILKWLPQSDILAHPNIKAFISHGGLLGTQEAVQRGVPVLGLPLIADQVNNLMRLEAHGVGIRLHFRKLNKEYIAKQLHKILNDQSYQKNMKELSRAFSDLPETPQQRALFWIQYVLRNSNRTTNYLRPSSLDLSWYQILLLDLVAVLAICLILLYLIFTTIAKCIINLFCKRKTNTSGNPRSNKKVN